MTDIADTEPEAGAAAGTATGAHSGTATAAATGAGTGTGTGTGACAAPGVPAAAAGGDGPALLTEPFDVPFPAPGIVRAVRRRADASQRELARFARVHPSTIGRIEAGTLTPSLAMLSRIIGTAGFRLVVVDEAGRVLKPMRDRADLRDGAERRYPSHLDVITDPEPGEWWADRYGLARPPETFYRNREVRDWLRRRSQWEVRVAKYRSVPPPPDPQRCGYRGGPPIRP